MIEASQPLLLTKLQRPRVTRNLIARPHLWAMLDRGLDKPLTLVCAAPGFGKSTLVGSWVERIIAQAGADAPIPVAWLSLDENDSDLTAFLRYFVAALRTGLPDACAGTLALLHSPQQPRAELLFATLINELADLPTRVILVLDDYSAIRGEAVNNFLVALIHNRPQPLHLVLITRHNPSLPLPALRARGAISELRSQHLRFSRAETTAYLEQVLATTIDEVAVAALDQRAEGWIAGLALVTLTLETGLSIEELVATLGDGDINVTEYLVDEVLSHQPQPIHAFLLKTSILDHFCAALCAAVIGEPEPGWSAAACIQWLVRANLFIIALDNQNEWYRYHHLFRDMLRPRARTELTADQVRALERRAATWFASQRLVDEALQYALRADDPELTVQLIEAGLPDALNREDRPTLERWLNLLPAALVARQPVLLMLKAWTLQFSWQLVAQLRVLSQIEAMIGPVDHDVLHADAVDPLRIQIALLRGQEAYYRNQPALAIERLTSILLRIPDAWTYVRGGAMLYLGVSMQANGQAIEVERLLIEQHEQHSHKADGFALRLQMALCFIYTAAGNFDQTRQTAHEMLRHAASLPLATMQSWAHYFLGLVCYQWNDLASAEHHFAAILERRHRAVMIAVRDGLAQLALTQQIRGAAAEAWRTLDLLSDLEIDQSGREEVGTRSMRALLLMLQGDLAGASRWADAFVEPVPDQPLLWVANPHMVKARILIARQAAAKRETASTQRRSVTAPQRSSSLSTAGASDDMTTDLESARTILDALYAIAERTYNARFKIEIQAMRALLLDLQGDPTAAESALRQAVDLARPGGFVRVFLDLGPAMQSLLERLAQQGVAVQPLLAAFASEASRDQIQDAANAVQPTSPARKAQRGYPDFVEPLTARERQVLALLSQPLSNKEIARRLNISTATVKRHTVNIYGKLGVNTRWDAVAKAAALRQSTLRDPRDPRD